MRKSCGEKMGVEWDTSAKCHGEGEAPKDPVVGDFSPGSYSGEANIANHRKTGQGRTSGHPHIQRKPSLMR